MSEEKKEKYFYMTLGYTGLTLVALAGLRYMAIYVDDTLGRALTLFGYIFLGTTMQFVEKKLFKVTKWEKIIFTGSMILIIFVAGIIDFVNLF